MDILTTNCPACGGIYSGPITSRFIVCDYCGTRYALSKKKLRDYGFIDEDGDGYDDREVNSNASDDSHRRRYGSSSSAPMYEYAREACENFLEEHTAKTKLFRSTNKILRGLEVGDVDKVYLIHDDTMLHTGKDGFAITSEGVYCRGMYETPQFWRWSEFANGERPHRDSSSIYQRAHRICYLTGADELLLDLEDLYIDLWDHAQGV